MFVFSTTCFSQAREELELNKSYSLAKIYKRSNQIEIGRNLTLTNDSTISYKNNKTLKTETISINDIRSLRVKSGTKVVSYTLIGAGSMASLGLAVYASTMANSISTSNSSLGTIVAGSIAGGAVIGALIGTATPKWKSISIPHKSSGTTSLYLNPNINIQKDYCVLSLNINF